ncbi:kinase-associated lipoprotein B [Fictibacillus gelatini]|uniref:kinase-associated lipoprotein B n=1 Tax=Fictibacillus gelatini TaxID=225985 RepID=UPI0004035C4C|nr:kinase-associated lipoprotein B [Fictibacillus gelatini]
MALEIGQYVTAMYKTGKYIGEIVQIRENKALINILAVLKHPMQGDLHHPKQADVPFFQQRKALAFTEKTWAPIHTVKPYSGEVPDYTSSLKAALETELKKLSEENSEWAKRSIHELEQLKKDYHI